MNGYGVLSYHSYDRRGHIMLMCVCVHVGRLCMVWCTFEVSILVIMLHTHAKLITWFPSLVLLRWCLQTKSIHFIIYNCFVIEINLENTHYSNILYFILYHLVKCIIMYLIHLFDTRNINEGPFSMNAGILMGLLVYWKLPPIGGSKSDMSDYRWSPPLITVFDLITAPALITAPPPWLFTLFSLIIAHLTIFWH